MLLRSLVQFYTKRRKLHLIHIISHVDISISFWNVKSENMVLAHVAVLTGEFWTSK